jgi:hypothetical protein
MLSLPMKLFSLIVLNKSSAICSAKMNKTHHMCYLFAIWLGEVWFEVIVIHLKKMVIKTAEAVPFTLFIPTCLFLPVYTCHYYVS